MEVTVQRNGKKVMVPAWRKMENKSPVKLSGKTISATLIGIVGALMLGIGMCLTMVWGNMVVGIVVGIVGIVLLLCLIPFIKGLNYIKDRTTYVLLAIVFFMPLFTCLMYGMSGGTMTVETVIFKSLGRP